MQRRDFLKTAAAALAAAGLPVPAAVLADPELAEGLRHVGPTQAFDYRWLKDHARQLAAQAFVPPPQTLPAEVGDLSWDAYQSIRFRPDHALWHGQDLRFEAKFFHLGLFFKSPVHLYEVVDGRAQQIAYDPALFDYGNSGVDGRALPEDLGFAGFRLNFHTDLVRDVAAFLGASYFRAVGGQWQYGQSARGLAVNTGMPEPEEFPNFTAFWLQRPASDSSTVIVYALLDSPSIAGAYRFAITPGDTLIMDVDAALYPRTVIERLGIAPCTSMYQYGENDRRMAWDWRPEIHDTDGLYLWNGSGEWIWRPLTNPRQLAFNAFVDTDPRGFGLLQRDRNFDHYQDDGVFYEKRPSLWVEPKSAWGPGSVQLIEIPTVDETFDNIVAFWNPERKPQPGEELLFGYRLYWGAKPPVSSPLAHCVATRAGLGGVVGQKREYFSWRFAVDFQGGDFALIGPSARVEPVIWTSRGRVEITSARPLHAIGGYRAMFDLVPPDDSSERIDIRLFLHLDGQALTETWLYQWSPPPPEERILY